MVYTLGIDIGSSSVKVALLEVADYPADFVGLPVGREELRAIRDREAERMER